MIKKIPASKLIPGMFVHDLNASWIPHAYEKIHQKGMVKSEKTIQKALKLGIKTVYIDTDKGLDYSNGIPEAEVDQASQHQLNELQSQSVVSENPVSIEEEMGFAHQVHEEAKTLVNQVMHNVKLGQRIELDTVDTLADGLLGSVFRNKDALSCLGRIRQKDSYLLEHSVNLSVLMSVFGKARDVARSTLHKAVVGALLHDIGKVLVPNTVLQKPSKLSDQEFEKMKAHATYSHDLLMSTPGISDLTIEVASQHHERMDGSGYPNGLKGEEISIYGRMVAIVDVYDAITADRCYHKGMPPTAALKKLLEWSGNHLDPLLVQEFIRCVGIYPVGSLVRLSNDHLGIVVEQNEAHHQTPVVMEMYDAKFNHYLPAKTLDLGNPSAQQEILGAVNPTKYKIDVNRFLRAL